MGDWKQVICGNLFVVQALCSHVFRYCSHNIRPIWWNNWARKASVHFDLNGFIKSLINGTIKHVSDWTSRKRTSESERERRPSGRWRLNERWAVSYQACLDHVNRVICLMIKHCFKSADSVVKAWGLDSARHDVWDSRYKSIFQKSDCFKSRNSLKFLFTSTGHSCLYGS